MYDIHGDVEYDWILFSSNMIYHGSFILFWLILVIMKWSIKQNSCHGSSISFWFIPVIRKWQIKQNFSLRGQVFDDPLKDNRI